MRHFVERPRKYQLMATDEDGHVRNLGTFYGFSREASDETRRRAFTCKQVSDQDLTPLLPIYAR